MLRYCAWCGQFQGAVKGKGHQIRKNRCEIDTSTICPSCFALVIKEIPEATTVRIDAKYPLPLLS